MTKELLTKIDRHDELKNYPAPDRAGSHGFWQIGELGSSERR